MVKIETKIFVFKCLNIDETKFCLRRDNYCYYLFKANSIMITLIDTFLWHDKYISLKLVGNILLFYVGTSLWILRRRRSWRLRRRLQWSRRKCGSRRRLPPKTRGSSFPKMSRKYLFYFFLVLIYGDQVNFVFCFFWFCFLRTYSSIRCTSYFSLNIVFSVHF